MKWGSDRIVVSVQLGETGFLGWLPSPADQLAKSLKGYVYSPSQGSYDKGKYLWVGVFFKNSHLALKLNLTQPPTWVMACRQPCLYKTTEEKAMANRTKSRHSYYKWKAELAPSHKFSNCWYHAETSKYKITYSISSSHGIGPAC
ncbi:hypothetical protein BDN71DRAFT_1436769 [Pleurotus eryngii]|uniref:Uncharacterized protein n=1 Tax=Pleurotus eryngii TaxID=5323 RepID=A0A9P5ZJ46_PLEER|nr:hypothetical protein BDN71DRAFT_1436769 [Pleurotus eryngii]